jgi:predicted secreted Zn-dependent protease
MEPTALIQTQDRSGNWITTTTTINQPTYVLTAMRQTKEQMGAGRVRAVDSKGRLLDIL